MFILNKLMLLKLNNIVPQKCSVHRIITGFIKNINSWCTTVMWSRAKGAGASLLSPPVTRPLGWEPWVEQDQEAAPCSWQQANAGVTPLISPHIPRLQPRSS